MQCPLFFFVPLSYANGYIYFKNYYSNIRNTFLKKKFQPNIFKFLNNPKFN